MASNYVQRLYVAEDGAIAVPIPRAQVVPVAEWGKNADGKSEQTGRQAVDAAGVPLWELAAAIYADSFGTPTPETVVLRMAAPKRPEVGAFFPGGDWSFESEGSK